MVGSAHHLQPSSRLRKKLLDSWLARGNAIARITGHLVLLASFQKEEVNAKGQRSIFGFEPDGRHRVHHPSRRLPASLLDPIRHRLDEGYSRVSKLIAPLVGSTASSVSV